MPFTSEYSQTLLNKTLDLKMTLLPIEIFQNEQTQMDF